MYPYPPPPAYGYYPPPGYQQPPTGGAESVQEVQLVGGEAGAPKLMRVSRKSVKIPGTSMSYHLDGELVPVLIIDTDAQSPSVYFEHHVLLWKSGQLTIGMKQLKNSFKRFIAGIQIFLTESKGAGQIAFSRDGPGQIVPIHLTAGSEIHVREHQFLAATGNVDVTYESVKGLSNVLFGGTGFFIDKFRCTQGEGVVWLHGYGNVFEKTLAQNETIDIEPGGWLYKDATVRLDTNFQNISTGFLASFNLTMNRFTGPGRIAIQSMYLHMPTQR